MHRLFKTPGFLLKAPLITLLLAGCGMDLDRDPLAFLSVPPQKPPANERAQGPAPPDLTLDAPALVLKKDGPMGVFGLNLETYFADDMGGDQNARIERLERALIALHRDTKVLVPPVQHYTEQQRMKIDTVAMHAPESLVGPPAPPASPPEEMSAPAPPAPAPPPVETGTPVAPGPRSLEDLKDHPVISGIRVGEHSDRVRIVFDVTRKNTPYRAELDNNEHILVVELPQARWETPATQEAFGRMPLLKSYTVEPFNGGQGRLFVLQLKKPTTILSESTMEALSGAGERIVIDLAK